MNSSRDERELRASDADRDRVAERLREAAAEGRLSLTELDERIDALYGAKTYRELDLVVDDLPGVGLSPAQPPALRERSKSPRVGGTPGVRSAQAVFSNIQRQGRWVVPSTFAVRLVFGGAKLDLSQAQLETDDVEITVEAVFAGASIIVPEAVYVIVDVTGVFGEVTDGASADQPPDGAPVLRITGKAVFGGVDVKRVAVAGHE